MKTVYPATLLCDFYKVSHREQYPKGTTHVYSTWTPRMTRIKGIDKVVMFNLQGFIAKYLIDYFNEHFFFRNKVNVTYEYFRFLKYALGVENPDTSHIAALHDLGYLPIEIKAVKEGSLVPIKCPMLTIENTHPDFFWVTNYIETLISSEIWQAMTSATIAFQYRKILNKYAVETGGDIDFVPFQGHDFSFRGMVGLEGAAASGAGHLLSFLGTDTIPAISYLEEYYNTHIEEELIGTSIPATEHSVMCANGQDELAAFRRLITEVYPKGFVSIVSDTWDFWGIIEKVIPALKQDILSRDGKVVIRPDSGDPVEILCGKNIPDLTGIKYVKTLEDAKAVFYEELMDKIRDETPHGEHGDCEVEGRFKFEGKYYELEIEIEYNRYDKQYYYIDEHRTKRFEEFAPELSDIGLIEALWNIFGGTINEKGFKELDSHIGAIYGDSITLERCEQILIRLKNKGFASTNVVLGIGSFTYQYNTRDTFGFAMKATHCRVNGEERMLFKDPKTDSGVKRSQRGRVIVTEGPKDIKTGLSNLYYKDNLTLEEQEEFTSIDKLETVFLNGDLVREQTLNEIRTILQSNL